MPFCAQCPGRNFVDGNALRMHRESKHTDFECRYCDRTFATENGRENHETAKHSLFECEYCDRRFSTNEGRMAHQKAVHDKFECRHCDRTFTTEDGREDHETAKHFRFECEYCDRRFSTDGGRLAHQADRHDKFECRYCDRLFNSDGAREQHEDAKHRSFDCRYCDRTFSSEDGREDHEDEIHFVFKCHHCVDTWFTSDQAREAHTRVAHHDLWCSTCGRDFSSPLARSQHEEDKHRRTRPLAGSLTLPRVVPVVMCDHCLSTFTSQAAKDAHLRSCSYNPANSVTQSTWAVQPITSTNQYSDDESEVGTAEMASPSCSVVQDDDEGSGPPSTIEAKKVRFGDEVSAPLGPPSCLSDSISGEGETFHSTGGTPPIGAIGVATPAEQSCGCSICQRSPSMRGEQSCGCSICQRSPSVRGEQSCGCSICQRPPSLQRDVPVPDDAEHPALAGDHHQGDAADRHDGILRCIPCLMLFDTADALQKHVCASRTALLRCHCPICYSQFDDEPSLQRHLEGVEFTCQYCPIRCCSDEMLQDHLLSHPTCGKCSQTFVDNLALCAHVESSHPVVVCWDCDGVVVDQADLALHYAASPVHPSCSICGLGTKDAVEMEEHVKRVHAAIEEGGVASLGVESQPLEGNQPEAFDRSSGSGVHTDRPGDVSRDIPSPAPVPTPSVDDANATHVRASPPSPTPSEHGSNASRPLVSPVSFDTASLTSLSDASASLVFVSADGIPEYVRDNRAILVATSARPVSAEGSASSPSLVGEARAARAGAVPGYRLHCRICLKDPCEDVTATICGHLFCKRCITQVVVATSECPVCRSATLLYCLFKLDLSA